MELSLSLTSKIRAKILEKVNKELDFAIEDNSVEDFLEKYGIILDDEEAIPVNPRIMKILVLGALAGNLKDYQITVKKMGIDPSNIEFQTDYKKLKRFDAESLKDSFEYSDIIYGPNPHKQINIDDNASLLSQIKNNPSRYPRLIEASDSHGLKISISTFKQCLFKTRYIEALNY